VIARQDHDVTGVLTNDGIQVLIHRVGGALIPVLADALLRRQDFDELAELLRHHRPALADVAAERQRLVLRGDENVSQPRVDAVAQDEVDDAVRPAEVDGGFGAISRQRCEPFAGAASKHDYQDVVAQHGGLRNIPPHEVGFACKPLR
jgi:hypothetical protein